MQGNNIRTVQTGTSPFDAIRRTTPEGREFWSGREMQPLMGYDSWRRFADAIDRAKIAAFNSGHDVTSNFAGAVKISETKPAEDFHLSRFACYLVAMSGDPRKPEVAAALAYFAIRTREAETAPAVEQPLRGAELMAAGFAEAMKALDQRDARILQLNQKIADDAPKVGYIDQFVADEDLMKFRTVASNLGVGEKWLRELLIAKRWIYAETTTRFSQSKGEKETVTRYSAYADKKRYFRPVEVHEAPRFKGETMHTLKVTPVGAEAISRLVAKTKGQAA